MKQTKQIVLLLALALTLFAAGCRKKPQAAAAPPPPPAPPPKAAPAKPVISSFEAEPSTIERGQAASLRWSISGEPASISIEPGIGTVPANGSRQVYPSNTTTYTLRASNEGGEATLTATVNVTAPAPAAPPAPPAKAPRTISEALSGEVGDALFDYDSSAIREDARSALSKNAEALKTIFNEFPGQTIIIEGHADERGSAEYNLGLADRRASAAKEYVTQLGVAGDRLKTVSYGKERPQCTEATETCYQSNRRAHFAAGQ